MSAQHLLERLGQRTVDLRSLSDAYAYALCSKRSESVRERRGVGSMSLTEIPDLSCIDQSKSGALRVTVFVPNVITSNWCIDATAVFRDNGYPDVLVDLVEEEKFTLSVSGRRTRPLSGNHTRIVADIDGVRTYLGGSPATVQFAKHHQEIDPAPFTMEAMLNAARLRKAGWPMRLDNYGHGHIDADALRALCKSETGLRGDVLDAIQSLIAEDHKEFDPTPILRRYLLRLWSSGAPIDAIAAMSESSFAESRQRISQLRSQSHSIGMDALSSILPLPVDAIPDASLMQRDMGVAPSKRILSVEQCVLQDLPDDDSKKVTLLGSMLSRGVTIQQLRGFVLEGGRDQDVRDRLRDMGVSKTEWHYMPETERQHLEFLEGWEFQEDSVLSATYLSVARGEVPIQWVSNQVRMKPAEAWEMSYYAHLRQKLRSGGRLAVKSVAEKA